VCVILLVPHNTPSTVLTATKGSAYAFPHLTIMCPVQDDPQHHHHQPHLPIAGRPHSNSTSDEEGFSIWRGRRIRKDVGSWPCDTIELEVGLSILYRPLAPSFALMRLRVEEGADG
jgi:hypothetical protein